jgi:hypothetical protein
MLEVAQSVGLIGLMAVPTALGVADWP